MSRFASAFRFVVSGFASVSVAATCIVTGTGTASASVPGQLLEAGSVGSHESPLGVPAPPSSAFLAETTPAAAAGSSTATPAVVARPADIAWSVSLVAPNTDIVEGQTATLTAYLNQPLDGSGMAAYIYGYAVVDGVPEGVSLTTCDTGSSCSATAAWQQNPAVFQAFVAPAGLYVTDMMANSVAQSNTVTIPSSGGGGQQPWQVSLSVSPLLLARGKSVTVVAAANQSVAGSGDQVVIERYSPESQIQSCGSGNGCTWTVPWTPNSEMFQAFIGQQTSTGVTNIVAESQPATVTGLDWQVQLFDLGGMNAEVVSNRPVGAASSTVLMLYDVNTRTVLARCSSGTSCQGAATRKGDGVVGYVVPDDRPTPSGVWLAKTGVVTFPGGASSGGNPAGLQDGRPCTCDPVDPADGALHESATDIVVPGRGPGLAVTRDYESANAGVVGRFGYGWTDASTMQIVPAPNADGGMPASLADATNVRVVQETGAPVDFAGQADGSFTTASTMLASLVRNPDGTFTFTRMKRSVFSFDAYGQLVAESDLHANTTRLSYDAFGRLAGVDPLWRTRACWGSSCSHSALLGESGLVGDGWD